MKTKIKLKLELSKLSPIFFQNDAAYLQASSLISKLLQRAFSSLQCCSRRSFSTTLNSEKGHVNTISNRDIKTTRNVKC